jgi:uncharacterized secreted protein with C-terminal beta-propeller domain
MPSNILKISSALSLLALLFACSGSDNPVDQPEPRPTEPPIINQAKPFTGALTKVGQISASRYIKNGIYSATQSFSTDVPVTAAPEASFADGFSTTNTQEAGVDEADRVEYDGDFLYLAAYPQWREGREYQSHVRVLQRNADFSLNEVNVLGLDDKNANINGIYHHQQHLAVLSTNTQVYTIDALVVEPWSNAEDRVVLDVYDVSNPVDAQVSLKIEFDGTLLSSRRIDNQLYLVTSYVANVEGLNLDASTDEELLANYLAILDTPDGNLMPKAYVDGSSQALNSPQDCAIPAEATSKDGYAQLLTVIRIDMQQPSDISASCMSTVADVMYMSTDNIYLGSTVDNQTALHKISLDNDLSYQASGIVDGIIGWRGPANLRLSEKDGYLRIVSSDYQERDPEHFLSILNQQGSELVVVANLPNENNPEPIGKPREDIFAVRFFGDRGYIVTFEQIDPLYVIDLADPLSPSVTGALEVPGFSSYLHPLDNNYLLGVGQQISGNDIPETGSVPIVPVTEEGMKVSLFDVSDPANPIELNSVVKENGYTPVEYDYRSLAVLNIAGSYQFAMPLEQWGQSEEIGIALWAPTNSLLLLEVDTQSSNPELIERAQISVSNDQEHYIYGGDDRSVIHGEHIYYVHGNQIWHSLWQSDPILDGPY